MSQGKKFDAMMHGELSLIENNARMFATITSEANQIVPLLTQKFMMRIKSGTPPPIGVPVNIMGKWIECQVDWEYSEGCILTIRPVKGYGLYMFGVNDFAKHVTQKGLAPRMFNAWKSTQE